MAYAYIPLLSRYSMYGNTYLELVAHVSDIYVYVLQFF